MRKIVYRTPDSVVVGRILILAGVASLAFGLGTVLFAVMVALVVPGAIPFILPRFDLPIGVSLILGWILLAYTPRIVAFLRRIGLFY